jgi:hypothetical protein
MKVLCEYEMVVVNMRSEQVLDFNDDAGFSRPWLRYENNREFSISKMLRDLQCGFFLIVIHEFSSFDSEHLILLNIGCANICALMRAS